MSFNTFRISVHSHIQPHTQNPLCWTYGCIGSSQCIYHTKYMEVRRDFAVCRDKGCNWMQIVANNSSHTRVTLIPKCQHIKHLNFNVLYENYMKILGHVKSPSHFASNFQQQESSPQLSACNISHIPPHLVPPLLHLYYNIQYTVYSPWTT